MVTTWSGRPGSSSCEREAVARRGRRRHHRSAAPAAAFARRSVPLVFAAGAAGLRRRAAGGAARTGREEGLVDTRGIRRGLGGRADPARPERGQPVADAGRPLLRSARRAGRAGAGHGVRRHRRSAGRAGCAARHGRGGRRPDRSDRAQADHRPETERDGNARLLADRCAHLRRDRPAADPAALGAAGGRRRGMSLGLPAAGRACRAPGVVMSAPHILLTPADWLALFAHFLMLSLLSIGGAITTAPEVQRYMVYSTGWISAAQFNASIALAQAAPGPNLLFVALVGWNLGLNVGGGLGAGLAGWAWR